MGYVAHDMVIVTTWQSVKDCPDVEAFRQTLPEEWRRLVVGPIHSVVNGDNTWVFAPDGSKSGWGTDEEGDRYREQFAALFSFSYEDGSSPFDVVRLTYGSDHRRDFDQPQAEYVEASANAPSQIKPPKTSKGSQGTGESRG